MATAGTLAALIPPSGLLILYGILTEASISHLFIGGLIPGIINIFLYGIIIFGLAAARPDLVPKGLSFTWHERFVSLWKIFPAVLVGVFTIGALYLGFATPTEIAGLGAFFCIIVALIFSGVINARIPQALLSTARQGTMLLLILVSAMLFSRFLALSQIPTALVDWIECWGVSRGWVLLALIICYIIMGTFMDVIAIIVVTTPVVYPLIQALGFNPIWWGRCFGAAGRNRGTNSAFRHECLCDQNISG